MYWSSYVCSSYLVLVDVRQVAAPDAAHHLAAERHVRSVVERHALADPRAAVAAPGEHQHLAHGLARLVGPAAFAFVVDDARLFLAAAPLHIGPWAGDGASEPLVGVDWVGPREDRVPAVTRAI